MTGDWPSLGLGRKDWPKNDENADVRLEWSRKSACFPPHGHLICGVCTGVKKHRVPFTKETRPALRRKGPSWPAIKVVESPVGRFWEGDNLKEYRECLVKTILESSKDLTLTGGGGRRSSIQLMHV